MALADPSPSLPGHSRLGGPHPRLWALGTILFVAVVYLATLAFLPKHGFWVVDNCNKYLQVLAAVRSGGDNLTIEWPGQGIDRDYQFNPVPYPFSTVQNGKIYSIYPPLFPLLSALLYRVFGFAGLYVLPFLFSLLMLAGLWRLARLLGLGPGAQVGALLLTALGTPLWFYSVNFWEHTIAVCLCVWCLVAGFEYVARRSPPALFACAALPALGMCFRNEFVLLLPLVLALLLVQLPREDRPRTVVRFVEFAFVGLLPLWLLNWKYTGNPVGFHVSNVASSSTGILGHLTDRGVAFYRLFISAHELPWASVLLTLPYLVLFLWNPSLDDRRFARAVPLAALVASVSFGVTFAYYFVGEWGPLWHLLDANSLFSVAPLLILAFLRHRDGGAGTAERRVLWLFVLAYALSYGLLAPRISTFGGHWGNRFLLILYPFMALLCAGTVAEWWRREQGRARWGLACVVAAAVLSLSSQVFSVHLLYRASEFNARFNQAVAETPEEIVVTDNWSIPQSLCRVFERKKIFYLPAPEAAGELRERLAAAGTRRILLIESTFRREKSAPGLPGRIVEDNGLQMYGVRLTSVPLRSGATAVPHANAGPVEPPVVD